MKIKDFTGKVAYITGGSSGIGLATARLLASKGASVIIFARRAELLAGAVNGIKKNKISEKQRFSSMQLDVANRLEVEIVLQKAVKEFGAPDILINSAGISYPHKFEDIPYETFDGIIKTNLYGIWNMIYVLLPYMKQGGGYIMNVSSIAGFIGVFGLSAYSASKFGVVGLSEALRSELKRFDITVSVFCPGDVDTPMMDRSIKIRPEETKAVSATASMLRPEDVAQALVKSMAHGGFMVLASSAGKFTYNMKRLFPWLVEWVTGSQIKKVQRKGAG